MAAWQHGCCQGPCTTSQYLHGILGRIRLMWRLTRAVSLHGIHRRHSARCTLLNVHCFMYIAQCYDCNVTCHICSVWQVETSSLTASLKPVQQACLAMLHKLVPCLSLSISA